MNPIGSLPGGGESWGGGTGEKKKTPDIPGREGGHGSREGAKNGKHTGLSTKQWGLLGEEKIG